MKQKISIVLVLLLAFSFIISGCGCRHQWNAPTCTEAGVCTVCKQVQGAALGHNKGEWETGEVATIFNSGTRIRPCTRCGMTMATERYELSCYSENGLAVFSPSEFTRKFNEISDKLASAIKAEEYSMNGVYVTSLTVDENKAVITSTNKINIPIDLEKLRVNESRKLIIGIRSEDIQVSTKKKGIEAVVTNIEVLGSECLVYLVIDGIEDELVMKIQGRPEFGVEDTIYVSFALDKLHLFDKETENSILNRR